MAQNESGLRDSSIPQTSFGGLLIVGRVLLGGLFVAAGIRHFFILAPVTSALAARGVPAARVVLVVGSVFQLIAGLLFMLGIHVAIAAFGLVLFTVVASILLLNFWNMEGPARETARTGWQTNLAIVGGLLIAAAQEM